MRVAYERTIGVIRKPVHKDFQCFVNAYLLPHEFVILDDDLARTGVKRRCEKLSKIVVGAFACHNR